MEPRWADVVRRAQLREQEAFEMLVEQHVAAVFRLAAAIVGPADAADVTQETFVTAWQQIPRLRKPDAFEAWLRRICVNRARNWLRDARRRPHGNVRALVDGEYPVYEDAATTVETRLLLESAFQRLGADQRVVLALHYSLGYSIADTADALGVPTGTVKSRLSSGLKVLRQATAAREESREGAS
jgi:RNA polymerase sigma-70 factor (ECF subfamily)